MWAALSLIGRLSWPLIGSLVPSMSPRLVMALAAFLALLVAIGGPAGAVWLNMRGEVKKAEIARDLHWTLELQKAKEINDAKVQAAIEAAAHEQPVSHDRVERVRQCKQSASCRERRAR